MLEYSRKSKSTWKVERVWKEVYYKKEAGCIGCMDHITCFVLAIKDFRIPGDLSQSTFWKPCDPNNAHEVRQSNPISCCQFLHPSRENRSSNSALQTPPNPLQRSKILIVSNEMATRERHRQHPYLSLPVERTSRILLNSNSPSARYARPSWA